MKVELVSARIIKKCQEKDQKAFKELYEGCLPYVFTIVKGYTKNSDFKKDLIQEIFAKLFLNIKRYDSSKGDFKPWLRKLVVNQCLTFLRDKMKHFSYDDLDHSTFEAKEMTTYIDTRHLDNGYVQQLMRKMPDGYRKVFSLIVFEGYTHDEVGQCLGISPDTSRSQLFRSKQWLRKYLKVHN